MSTTATTDDLADAADTLEALADGFESLPRGSTYSGFAEAANAGPRLREHLEEVDVEEAAHALDGRDVDRDRPCASCVVTECLHWISDLLGSDQLPECHVGERVESVGFAVILTTIASSSGSSRVNFVTMKSASRPWPPVAASRIRSEIAVLLK